MKRKDWRQNKPNEHLCLPQTKEEVNDWARRFYEGEWVEPPYNVGDAASYRGNLSSLAGVWDINEIKDGRYFISKHGSSQLMAVGTERFEREWRKL